MHPSNTSNRQEIVYAYDGTSWTVAGTPIIPPGNQLFVFDDARQCVLAVDFLTGSSSGLGSNTWELRSMAWQRMSFGLPRGRHGCAMAFDSMRGRTVLHGGAVYLSGLYDTWELADRTPFLGSSGISGNLQRDGHTLVFDEHRAVTIMFGGAQQLANNVLEWNGSGQWTGPQPPLSPPGRRYHAAAYDSLRARMLVFGGETFQPALADLWAWDGLAWTNVTPGASPPPRRLAGMSYDRDRDRIVVFGGTDGTTTRDDTWEFDGSQWLLITPPTSPPARSAHVQVYDSHLQRTVVYGGSNGQDLHDTWLWDGATWTQVATPHSPNAGRGAGAVYDSRRREVVLFGGEPALGAIWRLRDTSFGSWVDTGQGCESGNGPLTLTAIDLPVIGASARLELTHVPSTFFVLPITWVGFDDQQWEGLPLPLPLDGLGSPDCLLRTQPIVPLYMLVIGDGVASVALTLPNEPVFVGDTLFLQGFAWDFAQPRISTTNLLTARIGVR